jgi:phytoene dehydrogenase-like protein
MKPINTSRQAALGRERWRQHRAAHIHEALIVGGGFGGIGMGISLKRAGIDDFLILERGAGLGGVWRDNSYPGAACDVPSHLYSFSFEPNPGWSRTFASRDEIHAYLRHCAQKYALVQPPALQCTGRAGTLRRRRRGLARTPAGRRRTGRAHPRQRHRTAEQSRAAAYRGLEGFRRPGLPFGALGPCRRPGRQAHRRDRHRGLGHPVRPGHRRAVPPG